MEDFLKQINLYYPISEVTSKALLGICRVKHFKKNELMLQAGDLALYYYFVQKGLLGYYTIDENGAIIYKIFFDENNFVASTAAIIEGKPSNFNVIVLEEVTLITYPANAFRELVKT